MAVSKSTNLKAESKLCVATKTWLLTTETVTAVSEVWLETKYGCQRDMAVNERDMAVNEIGLLTRYGC